MYVQAEAIKQFYTGIVPPGISCSDIRDSYTGTAMTFVNDVCNSCYTSALAPYLKAVADFVWKFEDSNASPLPPGERLYLKNVVCNFLSSGSSWSDYVNSQILDNENVEFLGYIIGDIDSPNSELTIDHDKLIELIVDYLEQIHSEANLPLQYTIVDQERVKLTNLLLQANNNLSQSELQTLLDELLSCNQQGGGCVQVIWDISCLLYTSDAADE